LEDYRGVLTVSELFFSYDQGQFPTVPVTIKQLEIFSLM